MYPLLFSLLITQVLAAPLEPPLYAKWTGVFSLVDCEAGLTFPTPGGGIPINFTRDATTRCPVLDGFDGAAPGVEFLHGAGLVSEPLHPKFDELRNQSESQAVTFLFLVRFKSMPSPGDALLRVGEAFSIIWQDDGFNIEFSGQIINGDEAFPLTVVIPPEQLSLECTQLMIFSAWSGGITYGINCLGLQGVIYEQGAPSPSYNLTFAYNNTDRMVFGGQGWILHWLGVYSQYMSGWQYQSQNVFYEYLYTQPGARDYTLLPDTTLGVTFENATYSIFEPLETEVKITSLPAGGNLTFNGAPVQVGLNTSDLAGFNYTGGCGSFTFKAQIGLILSPGKTISLCTQAPTQAPSKAPTRVPTKAPTAGELSTGAIVGITIGLIVASVVFSLLFAILLDTPKKRFGYDRLSTREL